MVLNYLKVSCTTDEVWQKTGAGTGFVTFGQLQKAASQYNIDSHYEPNVTEDYLRQLLDKGVPVICVVHYGDLTSRQDKGFAGPHIFVVVGYRDDGYFVNDPDFWAQYRADGDHHFYTRQEFLAAWHDAIQDGNLPNSILYMDAPHLTMQIDTDLYTKLVTKASNFDTVANYFAFTEEQKQDPLAGSLVVNHIKQLQAEIDNAKASVIPSSPVPPTLPPAPAPITPAIQANSVMETDIMDAIRGVFAKLFGK